MNYLKVIVLLISFTAFGNSTTDLLQDGKLYVRSIDLQGTNEIQLKGQWKFHWKQYTNQQASFQKSMLVMIPGAWRGNYFFPNGLPSKGYGTYHLTLTFEKLPQQPLGILFKDIIASGEVWINGKLEGKRGIFSTTEKDNYLDVNPILIKLPKSKRIEITIPVSQYNHRMGGGMLDAPILGIYDNLKRKERIQIIVESCSTLIVLLTALYSISFYFFAGRRKIYLFFGLMCLMAMLRQVSIGVGLISYFFDALPFQLILIFRYIGFYLGLGFGALYFNCLFPQYISKRFARIMIAVSSLIAMYTILTANFYASYIAIPAQMFGLLSTSYVLVKLYSVLRTNDNISRFTLLSFTIFLITVINDILYTQLIIPTGIIQHIGFLLFAILQLYILMLVYKKQSQQIDTLNIEISQKVKQIEFKEKDIDYLAMDNIQKHKAKKEIIMQFEALLDNNTSGNTETLRKTIQELKNEILIEENVSNTIVDTQQIHYEFVAKLEALFPTLSKSEIEVCQLIRLNYSNKEIALKRKTADSTIKVMKHRIRTKVGVKTSKELEQLLINL